MPKKLKLGLLLFIVGFSGILTLLTVDVPIPSDISGDLANQLRQFKLLSKRYILNRLGKWEQCKKRTESP